MAPNMKYFVIKMTYYVLCVLHLQHEAYFNLSIFT